MLCMSTRDVEAGLDKEGQRPETSFLKPYTMQPTAVVAVAVVVTRYAGHRSMPVAERHWGGSGSGEMGRCAYVQVSPPISRAR